jgi:antirestriction protein ArdC
MTTTTRAVRHQEKIHAAAALLAAKVDELTSGDEFRAYLRFQGKFHHYSANNALLIWAQKPDATRVAGFRAWFDLGRCVRKGEHGIMIYVPHARKFEVETDDGTAEVRRPTSFGVGCVFDISQTDPLPGHEDDFIPERPEWGVVTGDDAGLVALLERVAASEGLALTTDGGGSPARGWYKPAEKVLYVRPEAVGLDRAQTLAHELSHHFAEHRVAGRPASEVVADGAAYVTLAHFGFEAETASVPYLALWSAGKPEMVREEVAEIQRVAAVLIAALERVDDCSEINWRCPGSGTVQFNGLICGYCRHRVPVEWLRRIGESVFRDHRTDGSRIQEVE